MSYAKDAKDASKVGAQRSADDWFTRIVAADDATPLMLDWISGDELDRGLVCRVEAVELARERLVVRVESTPDGPVADSPRRLLGLSAQLRTLCECADIVAGGRYAIRRVGQTVSKSGRPVNQFSVYRL